MKKILYLLGTSVLLFACGGTEAEQEALASDSTATNEINEDELLASNTMDPRTFGGNKHNDQSFIDKMYPSADNTPDKILGSYVGEFGKNMINITIYQIKDGQAEGYSVCAGNFRKIEGTVDLVQGDEYNFEMDEPGDDPYDGHFSFTLIASEKEVKGEWTPFKKEGNSTRKYKLSKREYVYDPTVGDWPEASQRLLTEDDVASLSEDELATMRNEIYARHGYSFKNKDWRYYFEGMKWYMPTGIDIRDKISDVEAENIQLIYEYESYYEDYYDDYGR